MQDLVWGEPELTHVYIIGASLAHLCTNLYGTSFNDGICKCCHVPVASHDICSSVSLLSKCNLSVFAPVSCKYLGLCQVLLV